MLHVRGFGAQAATPLQPRPLYTSTAFQRHCAGELPHSFSAAAMCCVNGNTAGSQATDQTKVSFDATPVPGYAVCPETRLVRTPMLLLPRPAINVAGS